MALELPQQLLVNTLDLSPLMAVLTSVSSKLSDLTHTVADLQAGQEKCISDIADIFGKVMVQQKHHQAMFETVTQCNRRVQDLERLAATKEDVRIKFEALDADISNLTESTRRLSINKIDKTSEELEVRVRAAAGEACVSFLSKKDTETKEYIKTALDISEQKIIRVSYARVDDAVVKLEARNVQLGHRIDDTTASVHILRRDVESEQAAQATIDRALVSKLEQHEIFFNALEDGVGEDLDAATSQLHMVLQRVFGVSMTDLTRTIADSETMAERASRLAAEELERKKAHSRLLGEISSFTAESSTAAVPTAATTEAEEEALLREHVQPNDLLVVPEEQLLRARNTRHLRRVTRSIEATKNWRNVHTASIKAVQGAPIACNNLDQGIDLNETAVYTKIDMALIQDLKAVTPGTTRKEVLETRSRMLADFYPCNVAPVVLKAPLLDAAAAASRFIMETRVAECDASISKSMQIGLDTVTKDLRGKMSNNKAMELIDQRTGRMMAEAMEPANASIELLRCTAVTRAEVYEALSNKADVSRMEVKADCQYVDAASGTLRTEFSESIGDLKDIYQKLLGEMTLFRHRTFIGAGSDDAGAAAEAAQGGQLARALSPHRGGGGGMGDDAVAVTKQCLSCHQPIEKKKPHPVQQSREQAMQDSQKAVHDAQLRQPPAHRTPSKPTAGPVPPALDGSGQHFQFNLGQWVQGVESKYAGPHMGASDAMMAMPAAHRGPGKARPPSAK